MDRPAFKHEVEAVKAPYWGADKYLARLGRKQARSPTRKETSSEACQGGARFQQNRDASCHQFSFPARQGRNSCHSDRNISLFPSCSS